MRMQPALAAVLVLALALPARAQPDCGGEKTQAGMTACFARALGEADFALNDAYQSLITRLDADPAQRARLTEAQRAWIRFRDAECAFATDRARGGSFHPAAQSQCLLGLTRQRVAQFREYLACGEGDLSCPVPGARK